jgi:hypothetical protein
VSRSTNAAVNLSDDIRNGVRADAAGPYSFLPAV